jgi:hypothetical protein
MQIHFVHVEEIEQIVKFDEEEVDGRVCFEGVEWLDVVKLESLGDQRTSGILICVSVCPS